MKRIFKLFMAMVGFTLLMVTCTKDKAGFSTFTGSVDLRNSTLVADQSQTAFLYSTDNGATFVQFPSLQFGQKYKVMVKDLVSGKNLVSSDFFAFDWSSSNPKPSDATSESPEFTLSSNNNINVKVTDLLCAYNASSWVGAWKGEEVPTNYSCGSNCTDPNNITQDAANPNKLIMNNFWQDGVDVYLIFSPSTTLTDQIVTMPEQVTADPGTASGTGTYDQCHGTFTINTTYVAFGSTYKWQYNFHR